MQSEVTLRDVTREDVDRIAGWLEDDEVTSRWFGHYACGDPVHRGYEPTHMLEASESEWDSVFRHDPHRFIFSIYNEEGDHIGECQVVRDDEGGAELSLLIGRKDLWHRGYGTSTVMVLLDRVFNYYWLERAWVSVPEDNIPAVGLFNKLEFVHEDTRELCKRRDGAALNTWILALSASRFKAVKSREGRQGWMPVVTITGLPGSGSEMVGAEIARMTGGRFIDDEILKGVCQRLRCSIGELRALEGSHSSVWSRMLRALVATWERYPALESGWDGFYAWPNFEYQVPQNEYLTNGRYLEALKSVITELALEGNVVLHGHVGHLFVPSTIPSLHVFVSASETSRQQRVATEQGLSAKNALQWLKRADREGLFIFKKLFGSDVLDMDLYDLVLNMERLSYETAARTVVGAWEAAVPTAERPAQTAAL